MLHRLLAAAILVAAFAPAASATASSELAGTSWRLVRIMSMDDRVVVPDDPSKYRLDLGADGSASMVADCNRGTGAWTSASPGQLHFGPIDATKALCPPGSLSENYLAEFQWVRSYTMKDGHLFLATMADGSIIEFAPMELPLAATVLGEEVRTSDSREMQDVVLTKLFDRYDEEQGIEVTDAEIDAFLSYCSLSCSSSTWSGPMASRRGSWRAEVIWPLPDPA